MPATPILSNGGTDRGLPISCFLNAVEDDLASIVDTWSENVWLASNGGGIGTYWGGVRSIGEPVRGCGHTSGIIPFVRVMDSLTLAISQGSLRRGSAAVYIDVHHPEIEEFIEIRKPSGDFNRKSLNLHHGVCITDEFMHAVRDDEPFALRSPHTGEPVRKVSARLLWQRLLETRLQTGEPYLLFIDTANRHLAPHQRAAGLTVRQSNLCSEILLPTGRDHLGRTRTAVCCLASVNLERWDEWRERRATSSRTCCECSTTCSRTSSSARRTAWPPRVTRRAASAPWAWRDGLPFLLAAERHPVRERARALGEPADVPPSAARRRCCLAALGSRARRLPRRGRARRRRALQPQARDRADGEHQRHLRRHERVHRADSRPTSTRTKLSPARSASATKRCGRCSRHKGLDTEATWQSILAHEGSVQHLEGLSEQEKAVFRTAFEIDQRWVVELAGDRAPLLCQGQSLNLYLGSDIHKWDLLMLHWTAWERGIKSLYYCRSKSVQRAGFAGVEADNTRAWRARPLEANADKYDECLQHAQ